jgi:DNA helicase-2/ATP-dependent DNA helicase PcrA
LLVPQRFHVSQQAARGDRHLWGGLSRFIPPAVAAHFESVCVDRPVDRTAAPTSGPAIDVAARVRSIWD